MLKVSVWILLVLMVGDALCRGAAKPGFCNYHGLEIKVGETLPAPVGECKKVTCREASEDRESFSALTCPAFVPAPECHVSEKDLTKRYPDCCPKSICPGDK